jgi:hypothetical protein
VSVSRHRLARDPSADRAIGCVCGFRLI